MSEQTAAPAGITSSPKIEAVTDTTGGLFAELLPGELDELHNRLRRARRAARGIMRHYWWHKDITDAYSRLVGDLSDVDPLFAVHFKEELKDDRYPMKVTKVPQVK